MSGAASAASYSPERRSPRRRDLSCSWSGVFGSPCSWRSTSSTASPSSRSRSSSWPATRATGRGRATTPAPAVRPEACRPRTCSRDVVEEERGAVGDALWSSTSTRSICRVFSPCRACRSAGDRRHPGGTRGRSRGSPGSAVLARHRSSDWPSGAAARAECARRARRGISSERPGVLAEARTEERRVAHLLDDEVLDVRRVDGEVLDRQRYIRLGEVQGDPVVRPDRSAPRCRAPRRRLAAIAIATARARGCRTEKRMQTRQSPISCGSARRRSCVQDGTAPVASCCSRRKVDQVARRAFVEVVVAAQAFGRLRVFQRRELARRHTDLLPELERTADAFALPERHRARHARRSETSTRSRVISSMRHVDAPSRKV